MQEVKPNTASSVQLLKEEAEQKTNTSPEDQLWVRRWREGERDSERGGGEGEREGGGACTGRAL